MTALTFPLTRPDSSPLQSGDQYTGPNGVIYVYDGVKWVGHASNPAGSNSISNSGNILQVDPSGNIVGPLYTFPHSTGTTSQVLVWPGSGSTLVWSDQQGGGSGNGYTGSAGNDGIGYTGSAGNDGGPGYTGSAGNDGIGYTGSAGNDSIGYTGSQGDIGYTGSAGNDSTVPGYVGSQGDIGYTGSAGADGTSVRIVGSVNNSQELAAYNTSGLVLGDGIIQLDTGHLQIWTGSSFNDVGSITGPTGYTGSQGDIGYVGSAGADSTVPGYIGSQGDIGYTGSAGLDGYQQAPWQLTSSTSAVSLTADGTLTLPSSSNVLYTTTNALIKSISDIQISAGDDIGSNWTFAGNGELTLPNGGHLGPVGKGWTGLDGGNGQPVSLLSYYANGNYSGCLTITPGNNVQITTYGDGTGQTGQWTFANDGVTTLPNSTTISDITVPQATTIFSNGMNASNGGANGFFTSDATAHPGFANAQFNSVAVGWYVSGAGLNGVKQITGWANVGNSTDYEATVDLTDGSTWTGLANQYTFYSPDYAVVSQGTDLAVNGHNYRFGSDGYLTLESITLNGFLKDVTGQTGTPGQVLSVANNGGIVWENYPVANTIANGTSSVTIPATDGSVIVNITGTTVVEVSSTGVSLSGTTVFPGTGANVYGQFQILPAQNTYVTATNATVIFTGSSNLVETMKATVQVQDYSGINVGGVYTYHSQICEILVVRQRVYDSNTDTMSYTVSAMVYGVVHTSTNPLATFDAQWNATTNVIEITMTRDSSYTGLTAKVIATESVNLAP